MPSKRTLQGGALILVSALLLAGLSPVVGGTGEPAALPHDAPEHHDGNMIILRGHGELVESIDDYGDLRRARATGRVRPASQLVPGDILVLQFRSERVNETFTASEGTTVTDRFFGMVETTDVNLSVGAATTAPSSYQLSYGSTGATSRCCTTPEMRRSHC